MSRPPKRKALPPKKGTPEQRNALAARAKQQRGRFSRLQGGWTRKEWNTQVRIYIANRLKSFNAEQAERQAP